MTANRISARRRLSATFFTFASLLALASVPATAETDTDEDVAATDTTADDTAAADQGSYGGDILVTARRRAETAQDVPIAISRSEEHTYELQSLMRNSYAVFCLTKK